ncbi:translation initiation factor IF-2 [Filifactor alocis]
MEKIRVYKLAQELNISSKKVIETAVKLSINVASHMSTLTADDSNKIRVTLSNASSKKETNKTVNQSKKKQLNQNYSEKDSDKILKKHDNKEKLKPSIISQPEAVDKNKGEDSLKNKKMKKKEKKNEKIKVKSAPIQENQSGYHNDKMMKKSKGKKHDYVNKKEKESKQDMSEVVKQDEGIFEIDDTIVVGDLAQILNVPATDVIMSIMKLGIMANINQTIKFETAEKVALDYDVMLVQKEKEEEVVDFVIEEDREEDLKPRSPIVTVMGHVDHGKTTLLDTIRNTKVTNSEAGGITQHIGASEVVINGKKIVFLDTPGHEAFTEMRARGAQVTDIVIIVVAADDGIMPQTIEAIDHVKAAGVPMIIAINKIDKPTANIDRVRQELSEKGILVESWGGTTIDVPVSAKTGEHIDDLLEMVLLVAEMEELRANPNRKAIGTVVESKLDKGRGTVATLIVQNGTLKEGDPVVAGTAYGRVRAMLNSKGKRIKKAGPSTAVEIQGLNSVPDAGDQFFAVSSDKEARDLGTARQERKREEYMKQTSKISLEDLFEKMQSGEMKELNIIVKADVQGSIDAIKKSFEKISNEEVVVKVIHGSVGAITESDVMLASASNAIIIGFNVRPATGAVSIAEREKVDMRTYRIIYEAIEDVEKAMKGMLSPEFVEEELGKAEVRMPFKVPKVGMIAGSYVLEGKIQRNAKVRLVRDGIVIYEGEIDSLRRFKDDVKEVSTGYDCGIGLTNYNDIKEGDIIENYIIKEIKKG